MQAHTLWSIQEQVDKTIRSYASNEYVDIKNECWLEEYDNDEVEEPLTREAFESALILEAIHVHEDGSYEFWFDDGDMFLGHMIAVQGSLANGPTYAYLCG